MLKLKLEDGARLGSAVLVFASGTFVGLYADVMQPFTSLVERFAA